MLRWKLTVQQFYVALLKFPHGKGQLLQWLQANMEDIVSSSLHDPMNVFSDEPVDVLCSLQCGLWEWQWWPCDFVAGLHMQW